MFFCMIAWCLRQNRNKLMFARALIQADAVVSWAGRFLGEFLTCNGLEKTTIPTKSPAKLSWQPPRRGVVKVNIDAAIHESLDVVGIGVVVRNEQGTVLRAMARRICLADFLLTWGSVWL